MNESNPSYVWSDGWLLAAIYGASLNGDPTLSRVLGAGDCINHAIFTLSELNGGLSRLRRGGFINIEASSFSLTEQGKALTRLDGGERLTPYEHMKLVRKRLGAADWIPGADPNNVDDPLDRTVHVTEDAFAKAMQDYRQSLKKPRKKKGEPERGPKRR